MVAVGTIPVLCDQLETIQIRLVELTQKVTEAYSVSILVFLRVDTCASSTIGRHSLVFVFSKMEDVLLFVIVNAFHDLWTN